MDDKIVLCAASFYNRGYYFNEEFDKIPEQVKDELKVAAALLAEKTRGISLFGFHKSSGDFYVEVSSNEGDFAYDEIGARLEADRTAKDKAELFKTLKLWYRATRLGMVKIKGNG